MDTAAVTLVTGGSSGIGAAVAQRLLDRDHRVTVTGRDPDKLRRFAERAGHPDALLTIAGDAADLDAVRSAVESTVKEFGRLDAVVACAGYATHDALDDGDPAGWRDMVLTNVLGPALLINTALPALKATRGRIVLIGSVAGYVYLAGNIYGATKFAVAAMAENTRLMVAPDGVGVTLVAPGRVDTNFWETAGGAPEGGILTADQVADSIVWALDQPAGVDVNTVVVRPTGAAV
ncbi:MAG TPA: SDR family NAD(P)-dependent oxidoreductase [Mycobacteriales bacterium]|jgi:NADP-dependent 3-hydroxy acid dehydrogenase YdfG|nr:SDR family NAD(P)-dependent oxidoreductase [Mycobacteriales bacterium]